MKIPKPTQEKVIIKTFSDVLLSRSLEYERDFYNPCSMLISNWSFIFIFNEVFISILSLQYSWKNWKSRRESIKAIAELDQNEKQTNMKNNETNLTVCCFVFLLGKWTEWKQKVRSSCSLWYLNFVHVILFFLPSVVMQCEHISLINKDFSVFMSHVQYFFFIRHLLWF